MQCISIIIGEGKSTFFNFIVEYLEIFWVKLSFLLGNYSNDKFYNFICESCFFSFPQSAASLLIYFFLIRFWLTYSSFLFVFLPTWAWKTIIMLNIRCKKRIFIFVVFLYFLIVIFLIYLPVWKKYASDRNCNEIKCFSQAFTIKRIQINFGFQKRKRRKRRKLLFCDFYFYFCSFVFSSKFSKVILQTFYYIFFSLLSS